MPAVITKDEARKLVENEFSGKIFTITFVKRTNGKTRVLNCRTGVRKNLLSDELRFRGKYDAHPLTPELLQKIKTTPLLLQLIESGKLEMITSQRRKELEEVESKKQ